MKEQDGLCVILEIFDQLSEDMNEEGEEATAEDRRNHKLCAAILTAGLLSWFGGGENDSFAALKRAVLEKVDSKP